MAYIEKAPKTNIRPAKDSVNTPWSKTRHIFNGDGQQCYKVMYAPTNNQNDLKTVWRENEIELDGKIYTFVEIGNLWWLQQNIDSSHGFTPSNHNWPRVRETNVQKYGYLYDDDDAQSVVSIAPPHWRLPTKDDFNDLMSAMQAKYGNNYMSHLISENTGGTTGTNDEGLGLMNAGYTYVQGKTKDNGFETELYYFVDSPAENEAWCLTKGATTPTFSTIGKGSQFHFSLRLCRDRIPWDNA